MRKIILVGVVAVVFLIALAFAVQAEDHTDTAKARTPRIHFHSGLVCRSAAWTERIVQGILAGKPVAKIQMEIAVASGNRRVCVEVRKVSVWSWSARLLRVSRSYKSEIGIVRVFTRKGMAFIFIRRDFTEA